MKSMKCKECNCCHEVPLTRWSSVDRDYVTKYVYKCYGVKEPFIIENINVECTEYPEYRNKVVGITNADKIRSINDGELANLLFEIDSRDGNVDLEDWYEWLKEPANEE